MAKVTIINGPVRVEVENGTAETVGELLALVRDEFPNIADTTPILNGEAVGMDAVVEDGDELAFTKPTGEKGR